MKPTSPKGIDGQDKTRKLHLLVLDGRPLTLSRPRLSGRQVDCKMGPGKYASNEGQGYEKNYKPN